MCSIINKNNLNVLNNNQIMEYFEIGQEVLCISDKKQSHTIEELNNDVPNWIKKGQNYTIREIVDFDFVVGLLLEEVRNEPKYFKVVNRVTEPTFASWRFRKLEPAEVEVEQESYVESL